MNPNLMFHGLGAEDFELSKYSDKEAVQEASFLHEFLMLQLSIRISCIRSPSEKEKWHENILRFQMQK